MVAELQRQDVKRLKILGGWVGTERRGCNDRGSATGAAGRGMSWSLGSVVSVLGSRWLNCISTMLALRNSEGREGSQATKICCSATSSVLLR